MNSIGSWRQYEGGSKVPYYKKRVKRHTGMAKNFWSNQILIKAWGDLMWINIDRHGV